MCDGKCTAGKAAHTLQKTLEAANIKITRLNQLVAQGRDALVTSNLKISELEQDVRSLKRVINRLKRELNSREILDATKPAADLKEAKTVIRRLEKQLEEAEESVRTFKLATVHDSERHERILQRHKSSKLRVVARVDAKVAESNARLEDLKLEVAQAEATVADVRSINDEQASKISKLLAANTKLSNRSKNRGRFLKQVRMKRDQLKEEAKRCSFLKCRIRKDNVKRSAMIARRKKAEAQIAQAISFIAGKYKLDLAGYGSMELMPPPDHNELFAPPSLVVNFKKGSRVGKQVGKFLHLCDTGLSKKKHHEVRMLAKTAVPSLYAVNKRQKELEIEINKHVEWEATEDTFLVYPRSFLAWLVKHRGLSGHDTLHLILEGDGRGTGQSFKSIVFQFRLLNEGRAMFREDRQYLLALMKGDEDYDLLKTSLEKMLKALQDLQAAGLTVDKKNYKVVLHSTGDAKWQKIMHGMCNFHVDDYNCLFCYCHASDRDELDVWWETETKRFDGPLGEMGRVKKDLLWFVPMQRRYIENMHLVFRFLHDKLLGHMFTDVINTESDDPARGMKSIEDILRSAPFKMTKFKFYPAKSKDKSADGAFTWSTPKLDKCLQIASLMEFKQLYKKNPGRGALLQAACRKFVQFWKRLQVWPGDGDPSLSAELIWKQHVTFLDILTTSCEGVPGTDSLDIVGLPLSIITPYAHMWCNHIGEQFEASKAYAKYFQQPLGEPDERMGTGDVDPKTWGGGLKFARSDAMERKNLTFFHTYFQTSSRRPKTVIREAGLQELRRVFNPDKTYRHRHFCCWCAKGYVRESKHKQHELECKQAPPEDIDIA